MSDFTDYLETAIRDWLGTGSAFPTAPGTVYVSLHTADPGESPDGSTEVSAGDYSRQGVSTSGGWNTTLNPTTIENANAISFTATSNNWGTISHVALWDGTADTDNTFASYALNNSVSIDGSGSDDTLEFAAGDLSFEIQ